MYSEWCVHRYLYEEINMHRLSIEFVACFLYT